MAYFVLGKIIQVHVNQTVSDEKPEIHRKTLQNNPISTETAGYCHRYPRELEAYADPVKEYLPRFFKTEGRIRRGDKFLGVVVPNTRTVAKQHKDVNQKVSGTSAGFALC